jgi:hypothetical protein
MSQVFAVVRTIRLTPGMAQGSVVFTWPRRFEIVSVVATPANEQDSEVLVDVQTFVESAGIELRLGEGGKLAAILPGGNTATAIVCRRAPIQTTVDVFVQVLLRDPQ